MSISHKVILGACLAAAMLIGAGCWRPATGGSSEGEYRTITVTPRRDTDAAKVAMQVGLEHLDRGELDQAADAFSRALTADIEFGPAHNNLGLVYFKQGEWYKAAWEFEYARKLLPRHAEPLNNLGLVHEEAGELDQAVDRYREAVRVNDNNIQYRANLVRAMIRRGDRTDEVRDLLRRLVEQDARPEWRNWAMQQQARMSGKAEQ